MKSKFFLSTVILSTLFFNQVFSQETALEFAAKLAPGVNLFNTLDAVAPVSSGLSSETYWGQPYTTKPMITAMKERGFKTLRLPVTWFNHTGPAPNYNIDPAWLDRVEEVANFAFDNDMYVIINMHHEDLKSGRPGSWLTTTYEKQDEVADQLGRMWTQIALHFKDYGEQLIFETMNEPREPGSDKEWSGGTAEHRDVMNTLNKVALEAIRNAGGENISRYIMLPQVGANTLSALEDMVIPNNDTATIVSVHAYSPYDFCLNESGTSSWGSASEISELQSMMNSLSDRFVSSGQAVVMGEWGATDKNNYAQRVNYYKHYASACKDAGITPIVWMFDFNRNQQTWGQPLVDDAILLSFDSSFVEVEALKLNKDADTVDIGEMLQLTADFIPESATSQDIIWSSDNGNVATVNKSGLVTAKLPGSARIKAFTLGAEAEFYLTVQDTLIQYCFFIEAEAYKEQRGIRTEACEDENGGWHVAYTREGYWCSYDLDIDTAGAYNFFARVATNANGGSIEITADDKKLGECIVDGNRSTGWQDWFTTDTITLELEEGQYDMLLTYRGEGAYLFNFNWFELSFCHPSAQDTTATGSYGKTIHNKGHDNSDILVYPNPATNFITVVLKTESAISRELLLVSISGQILRRETWAPGQNYLNLDLEDLNSGLYILRLGNQEGWSSQKLRIE